MVGNNDADVAMQIPVDTIQDATQVEVGLQKVHGCSNEQVPSTWD